ncbi:MAG: DNA polymerase III subunit delta [Desulfobulbaceae bacterium]|nr:DNA polymerase III subunit delta [Desulfobulbaceae bacterium]
MPTLKRHELATLWQAIAAGDAPPVFLLHGERYLCREVAEELCRRLLPDEQQRASNLHGIDGDQEDPVATLHRLRTFSMLPGRQLFRVMDTRLFYSKEVAKTLWEKAKQAHEKKELKKAGRLAGQVLNLAGLDGDDAGGELIGLAASRWRALLGFAKPEEKLDWFVEALAEAPPAAGNKTAKAADIADLYMEAFEKGLPPNNTLILIAEAADKRTRLYKYLDKNATVIDLAVDTGASTAARKDQDALLEDLIRKTLTEMGKKIDPRALPLLLDRVGFHPVAAVMETEKLCLSVGDAPHITIDDLEAMIGRTREEALFAFTEAVATRNLDSALALMGRLRENQIHPLVIVSGLRNHLRKLLFIRALEAQNDPPYHPGGDFNAFQRGYLAQLKAARPEWPKMLAGHPFVVYKLFQQAERFSVAALKAALAEILAAEYRLKGSGLPEEAILENMLFRILQPPHQQKAAARSRP